MVSISEFYRKSRNILENSGIESFDFDVRCIMEDVLKMRFAQLMAGGKDITGQSEQTMQNMIKKRSTGYPLQYILGEWEFYGLPFKVGEGVLIPRQDTETLADVVTEYSRGKKGLKILDLCSGSGCLAVAVEKNTDNSDVTAVELSEKAFEYLNENIKLNGSSVKALRADVLKSETAGNFRNYDVIMSNPPYLTADDMKNLQREVSYEPQTALYGKTDDGLEFYRVISEIWYNSLKNDGIMAFEAGKGQAEDIAEILMKNGFSDIKITDDLAGIARVVSGKK